jgi:hypothetical protein
VPRLYHLMISITHRMFKKAFQQGRSKRRDEAYAAVR